MEGHIRISHTIEGDGDLSFGARLLFGRIKLLAIKTGYCWASNAYFAKILKASPRSIQRFLRELEKSGYIKTKIDRKDPTNSQRIISIMGEGGHDKSVMGGMTNLSCKRDKTRERTTILTKDETSFKAVSRHEEGHKAPLHGPNQPAPTGGHNTEIEGTLDNDINNVKPSFEYKSDMDLNELDNLVEMEDVYESLLNPDTDCKDNLYEDKQIYSKLKFDNENEKEIEEKLGEEDREERYRMWD